MRRSHAKTFVAAMLAGACMTARAQAPASPQTPPVPAPAAPSDGDRSAVDARRAAADERPDLAFLEYLGSWQADDDEWLLIAEWHEDEARDAAENERRARAERRAAAEAEARRERAKRKDDEEGD